MEGADALAKDVLAAQVGEITVAVRALAFRMAHFAENPPAGAEQALDGPERAVGVVLNLIAGPERGRVGILEGNLALVDEALPSN